MKHGYCDSEKFMAVNYHVIICKLFVLVRNTWNHINVYKLRIRLDIHGLFNRFPEFFVQVSKIAFRLLKIQYFIAIHLMR